MGSLAWGLCVLGVGIKVEEFAEIKELVLE